MRLTFVFDVDDVLPCVCTMQPVQTAFPSATIVIDTSTLIGQQFAAKCRTVGVAIVERSMFRLASEG